MKSFYLMSRKELQSYIKDARTRFTKAADLSLNNSTGVLRNRAYQIQANEASDQERADVSVVNIWYQDEPTHLQITAFRPWHDLANYGSTKIFTAIACDL